MIRVVRNLLVGLGDCLAVLALGWWMSRQMEWAWGLPASLVGCVVVVAYRVYDFLHLKVAADSLSVEEKRRLVERLDQAQGWAVEFGARGVAQRIPKVVLTSGCLHYGPLGNEIGIPSRHLVNLGEEELRIAIAHEVGHAQRRWWLVLARTLSRRLKEEALADRFALVVTRSEATQWAKAVRAVAALEGMSADETSPEFDLRYQALQTWCARRAAAVAARGR